jgi:hypothetical protein
VCTAHLATRSTVEPAGNDAQCAELAALLERRAATRTVIFGGDVNQQLGHADPKMTLGLYARALQSKRRRPHARRQHDAIGQPMGTGGVGSEDLQPADSAA